MAFNNKHKIIATPYKCNLFFMLEIHALLAINWKLMASSHFSWQIHFNMFDLVHHAYLKIDPCKCWNTSYPDYQSHPLTWDKHKGSRSKRVTVNSGLHLTKTLRYQLKGTRVTGILDYSSKWIKVGGRKGQNCEGEPGSAWPYLSPIILKSKSNPKGRNLDRNKGSGLKKITATTLTYHPPYSSDNPAIQIWKLKETPPGHQNVLQCTREVVVDKTCLLIDFQNKYGSRSVQL